MYVKHYLGRDSGGYATLGGVADGTDGDAELLERLARVEHEQWVTSSKAVAHEVSPARRLAWEQCWVSYDELSADEKELDLIWARRALAALRAK